MFSAVKAITAGALFFALGGMLLIAQPFDQQGGGVPGAATDVEWAAPVEVTGTRDAGGCSNGETFRRGSRGGSDVEATRGFTCSPRWSMSDPRLEGTVTFVSNEDIYHEGSGLEIGASAISIENDEGVWRQRPTLFIGFPDQTEVSTDVEMLVLDGEGAYEGMVAVIEYLIAEDGGDDLHPQRIHGFIIDGELPPAPENASVK